MSTKIGFRPLALACAAALIATGAGATPAAAQTAEVPAVRITEFAYNGSEFVEFTNLGADAVDLSENAGWSFADSGTTAGAVSLASLGVIAPGESFLLAEGQAEAFRSAWGLPESVKVVGGNTVNLGRGDTIKIFDGAGTLVDQLVYGDNVVGVGGPRTDTASAWPNDESVLGADTVANWTRSTEGDIERSWVSRAGFPGSPGTSRFSAAPVELPVWEEPETPAASGLRINEVDSQPADWVEFFNPGAEPLDISGFEIRDDSDDHRWRFPAGTSIAPGAFLVVEESTAGSGWNDATAAWEENVTFTSAIGVGGADRIRLYDTTGALIDATASWSAHAGVGTDTAGYTLAREVDGAGGFLLARISKGASNAGTVLDPAIEVNEVNSNGGPNDYIEVINTSDAAIDVSGWYVNDDSARTAADITPLAAGTTLAPRARLVFEGSVHFTFGLGGGDQARVFTGAGTLVDEHTYPAHAANSGVWSACPEGGDVFVETARTPGEANLCEGGGGEPTEPGSEYDPLPWPGGEPVIVLDTTATFLEDSSGLDTWTDQSGTSLYAVDNGTGRFWKADVQADGSFAIADGWADGKRVRYQKDAGNPAAAGPDAEGITVDGDGLVYVASERDNAAKDVNLDAILKVDPAAPGPDLVALQEWDITSLIPTVGANLGIEAVEWIADADLAGRLWDTARNKPYEPADYPGHGDGLFFVAVEDGGSVHAFALSDDAATSVATLDPGLAGVMALDYDAVSGGLWTVCDNGCGGVSAFVELNGTAEPETTFFARPAAAPNENAEGFATAPAALIVNGVRPAWWFVDGVGSGALRAGTLTVESPQVVAGEVTVAGTARVGSTLTAKPGTWTEGATLSYQWLRDGAAIAGATSASYTPVAADAGRKLSVRVTGALTGWESATATSSSVTVSQGALAAATPSITGTVRVDSTVKVAVGAWTRGTTFSYQWYANGAAIAGATKSAYTIPAGYAGRSLTVKVTGSLPGYSAVSKVSAGKSIARGVLSGATPTISDTTPKVGQRISAGPGSWTGGVSRTYQWYANGAAIKGATSHILTVPASAYGKALTVKVTGTKSGYTTLAKTSRATAKVAAGTLSGATPTISDTTPKVGQRISARPGSWTSGVSRTYQWYADGAAIKGATSHILTVPAGARGKTLTVKVTGKKTGYSALVKSSRATAKVAAGTLSGSTPRISGTVKVGSKVTAVAGTWSSGVSRTYQWYANGAAIKGATSHILRVPSAAAGKTLTVKVTGKKAGYTTLVRTSAGKAVPRPAAPRPAAPTWTPRGDLDCGDFSSWSAAQGEFERAMRAGYGDYHRLDADNDGIACETLL